MLHQIGAGVLGPVFLARDADRQSFAIKVFRLEITPEQAAELAAELSKLARAHLDHPSIVAPVVAGVEGTVAYLAQEYVGADSLDAAIRQYGPAPLPQALRIVASVAGALDYARAVGVRHGSLHPRDLLVGPDEVKLTGLGVASAIETVGVRAPIRRPYTAPERVQREAWDGAADVYSLGVLASELIVGKSKRAEASSARLADEHLAGIQPILARATAARPSERFGSALEFARVLQEALGEAVADAIKSGASAAPARPSRDLLLPLDDEPAEQPLAPVDLGHLALGNREGGGIDDFRLDSAATPASAHEQAYGSLDLSELDADIASPDLADASSTEVTGRFTDILDEENRATVATGPKLDEPEDVQAAVLDDGNAERRLFADDRPPAAFGVPAPASRSHLLPYAAVLLVGLLIGAIVGYLYASRHPATNTPAGAGGSAQAASRDAALASQPAAPVQQPVRPLVPQAAATTGGGAEQPSTPAPAGGAVKDAPAAASPNLQAAGRLVIQSTPRRASVTINGRVRGTTPLTLRKVAPGRYSVRVSRRGYATEEREVVVSAEHPSSTLAFKLTRGGSAQRAGRVAFLGTLVVDSLPAGSQVFLDGKLVGKTPCVVPNVAAGSHVVRVDRIGFRRWAQPVQVASGQRVRITASLERESR